MSYSSLSNVKPVSLLRKIIISILCIVATLVWVLLLVQYIDGYHPFNFIMLLLLLSFEVPIICILIYTFGIVKHSIPVKALAYIILIMTCCSISTIAFPIITVPLYIISFYLKNRNAQNITLIFSNIFLYLIFIIFAFLISPGFAERAFDMLLPIFIMLLGVTFSVFTFVVPIPSSKAFKSVKKICNMKSEEGLPLLEEKKAYKMITEEEYTYARKLILSKLI